MSISFGKLSPFLTIPLTYALINEARMLIFSSKLVPERNSPFNSTVISSFAMLSIGILEIVSIYRQKHEKDNDLPNSLVPESQDEIGSHSEKASIKSSEFSGEHISKGFLKILPFINMNNSEKYQSFENISSFDFTIIFMIALSNFAVNFGVFNISSPLKIDQLKLDMEIRFIGFLYVCIICAKALKQEFHKHHIVSLIAILICECILGMLTFLVYFFNESRQPFFKFILSILWLLFCDIYFSTKHVIEKWLMDKHYISPFLLMFIEGVFSLLINLVAMFIFYFIPCFSNNEKSYCYNQNVFDLQNFKDLFIKNYIFVILFYISSIIIELCMTLTNKIYSPTYRATFDSLTSFVPLLYQFYKNEHSMILTYFVFLAKVIVYVVIIFCCMMFNEIIVVKIYGLNKDLKVSIAKRADDEYNKDKSNLGHVLIEEQKRNEGENISVSETDGDKRNKGKEYEDIEEKDEKLFN